MTWVLMIWFITAGPTPEGITSIQGVTLGARTKAQCEEMSRAVTKAHKAARMPQPITWTCMSVPRAQVRAHD